MSGILYWINIFGNETYLIVLYIFVLFNIHFQAYSDVGVSLSFLKAQYMFYVVSKQNKLNDSSWLFQLVLFELGRWTEWEENFTSFDF